MARFDAVNMSSDGGLLMLPEAERRLGLANRLAGCIRDPRQADKVPHGLDEIIRFRMLMIAAGEEDGNEADTLRQDPVFKLAMDRLPSQGALCSQPTISRIETLPDARALWRMGHAMIEHYCESFRQVPSRLCSTSTTPSAPSMAASNCACSMPITINTASSRSWCETATTA